MEEYICEVADVESIQGGVDVFDAPYVDVQFVGGISDSFERLIIKDNKVYGVNKR